MEGTAGLSGDHQDGIKLNTQVVEVRHLEKKKKGKGKGQEDHGREETRGNTINNGRMR